MSLESLDAKSFNLVYKMAAEGKRDLPSVKVVSNESIIATSYIHRMYDRVKEALDNNEKGEITLFSRLITDEKGIKTRKQFKIDLSEPGQIVFLNNSIEQLKQMRQNLCRSWKVPEFLDWLATSTSEKERKGNSKNV